MGPTTKAISVTGGITFEGLIENFRVQALGLMAGGADYLLLETAQDTRNVKAGLIGIERAFAQAGWKIPVAVSATIETTGTMLGGQDAEALAVSLLHADLLYVGLNCATGPDLMTDHVRTLSEICRTRVACVPNAGLPNEDGRYTEGPDVFERVFSRFLDAGWLNLVGGCCGTTSAHIAALARAGPGAQAAADPAPPARPGLRPRGRRALRGAAAGAGGRAHQRPRQPQVQAAHPGRPARGRRRGGPRPGQGRRRRSSTSASRTRTATRSATWRPSSTGSSAWSRSP